MMVKSLKLFVTALALGLFAVSFIHTGRSSAQTPVTPQRQATLAADATGSTALTPQERRGKALYLRGTSASGKEITAVVGEVDVPASTLTCAGCHGFKAEGKTEGGVTAGGLTWANLTKPYGHTHPSGRKHGPFNEAAFVRAVTGGIDPAGNELVVAMPRYKMSAEDMADLVAYLKRIETERDPGVTESSIKVGTILPSKGALAETGAAMRDVLDAYFGDLNSRGGIYNRRIELSTVESGTDAATTAANVRRVVREGDVFAVVGGLSAGADRELAALAVEEEIPFLGPSTLLTETGNPVNRYVFYLMPGLGEQARSLVNFAATKPELKKSRLVIVRPEGEIAARATAAIEDQAQKTGWTNVVKQTYARADFDARQLVGKIKGDAGESVFFLGSNGEDVAFVREASAAGWSPHLFLLGALMGRDLSASVPPSFKDRVFLSFPTVPADITQEGMAEFRALHEKYKFAPRHTGSQLAAFAAARTFVEGLKRAGKDLSRERFVTALEGLYEYDTGVTPRLTFGPNRRVGAAGAYIVTIDPEKKTFAPVGGWIKAY